MKMNSIAGITCYVADVAKTTAFYETLGFRIGAQAADRVTCYVNWFWMTFIHDMAANGGAKGVGMSVAIKVDDAQEFYNGLLAKGLQPEAEPQKQQSGNITFTLRDPDGYQLEFFEKK